MFSFKESNSEIDMVLLADPRGNIRGRGSIGGEIISSFCVLFNLMYSLKIISISSALKLVEKFSGVDFNTMGGSESISPPVGVPRLAQLNTIVKINKENLIFVILNSSLQRNA